MIRRYFYIFSAALFILITPTTGIKANIEDHKLEQLARQTNSPPDGFNYQAILRDNNGDVMANSSVTMRFTLSNNDGAVWIETHTLTTNDFGVISLVIGDGTQTGGTASAFSEIDWSTDISVTVESDSGNGFVDLGTTDLQSVPYSQFAANGLSAEQSARLDAVNPDAEENVQADWNTSDNTSDSFIQNKPSIPTDINELNDEDGLLNGSTFDGSFNSLADVPVNLDTNSADDFSGSYNDLTDLPANLDTDSTDDFSGNYNDLTNRPTIPADINQLADEDGLLNGSTFDGSYNSLTDVPVNLDTDATDDFSGSYNDLTDLPTNLDTDATDDFSGSYNDLTDLPTNLDTDATDDFSGSYNDLTDLPTNLDTDATDDFSGSYNDLTDLPTNLDTDATDDFSGSYNDLTDLPTNLDTDATDDFSGSYNDLTDLPTNLDTDATDDFSGRYNDLTDVPANLDTDATDDFSGDYDDLTNKPTIATDVNELADASGLLNTNVSELTNDVGYITNDVIGAFTADQLIIDGGVTFPSDRGTAGQTLTTNGDGSTAWSNRGFVSGEGAYSASFGGVYGSNKLYGDFSTAIGAAEVETSSFGATVTGSFNSTTGGTYNGWVETDPLFIIGNGWYIDPNDPASGVSRSDALIVSKNGDTDLNGSFTADSLVVEGAFGLPTEDGITGQVLTTKGDGTTYWKTASGGGSYAGTGAGSFVAGAAGNTASGSYATVNGGGSSDGTYDNQATGNYATVGGGRGNKSLANLSFIGGGAENYIDADTAFIGGGFKNYVIIDETTPSIATIAGGKYNSAGGRGDFIGGGYQNSTGYMSKAKFNTIAGGQNNVTSYTTNHTFIGGGRDNLTTGAYSTVAGGWGNGADSVATVGGGAQNQARGFFSTIPGGRGVTTYVYGGVALGMFNSAGSSYGVYSATSNATTDPVFVVGNGVDSDNRSDAMVMLKNGNTDINGDLTVNALTIEGAFTLPTSDGNNAQFLATFGNGTTTWADPLIMTDNIANGAITADKIADGVIPSTIFSNTSNVIAAGDADDDFVFGSSQLAGGNGSTYFSRMFFDKSKSAFRAGLVQGTQWDDDNVGSYSFTSGKNNIASGTISVVGGGFTNTASGLVATVAGGWGNTASHQSSFVGGGQRNTAAGKYSAILGGLDLSANSYGEMALGFWNTDVTATSAVANVSTDRLLVVGNGNSTTRSDALVMLKNGNTDFNGTLVANSLGVDGQFTLPTSDGISGQVLSTDGSGNVAWSNVSGGSSSTFLASSNAAETVPDNTDAYYISIDGSVAFTVTMPSASDAGDKVIITLDDLDLTSGVVNFSGSTTIQSVATSGLFATLSNSNPTIQLIYNGTTWLVLDGDFTYN